MPAPSVMTRPEGSALLQMKLPAAGKATGKPPLKTAHLNRPSSPKADVSYFLKKTNRIRNPMYLPT